MHAISADTQQSLVMCRRAIFEQVTRCNTPLPTIFWISTSGVTYGRSAKSLNAPQHIRQPFSQRTLLVLLDVCILALQVGSNKASTSRWLHGSHASIIMSSKTRGARHIQGTCSCMLMPRDTGQLKSSTLSIFSAVRPLRRDTWHFIDAAKDILLCSCAES
jgi:hypothetical protein